MRLFLLFIFIGSGLGHKSWKIFHPCFERYLNHKLINVQPFLSEYRMPTEDHCLRFCAETSSRCQAIVYDTQRHICHFFSDVGVELTSIAPKMTFFKVTTKECLDSVVQLVEPLKTEGAPVKYSPLDEANAKIRKTTTEKTTVTTGKQPTTMTPAVLMPNVPSTTESEIDKEGSELMDMSNLMDKVAEVEQAPVNSQKEKSELAKKLKQKMKELRRLYPEKYRQILESGERPSLDDERFNLDRPKEQMMEVTTTEKTTTEIRTEAPMMEEPREVPRKSPQRFPTPPPMYDEQDEQEGEEIVEQEKIEEKEEHDPEPVTPTPNEEIEMKEGLNQEDMMELASAGKMAEIMESQVEQRPRKEHGERPHVIEEEIVEGEAYRGSWEDADTERKASPHRSRFFGNARRIKVSEDEMDPLARRVKHRRPTDEQEIHNFNGVRFSPPRVAAKMVSADGTTNGFEGKAKSFLDSLKATPEKPTIGIHDGEIAQSSYGAAFDSAINKLPFTSGGDKVYAKRSKACSRGLTPIWVVWENALADTGMGADLSNVDKKADCEELCNQVETCRSYSFYDKDNQCEVYPEFTGISLKSSGNTDFSVSTHTKFCFTDSINVYKNCAVFEGFHDYALEVIPREQFDGLPPGYEGLQLCMELCILSSAYTCRSASFLSSEGKCFLNDQDSMTSPKEFRESLANGHLYFENGCSKKTSLSSQERREVNVERVGKTHPEYASFTAKVKKASPLYEAKAKLPMKAVRIQPHARRQISSYTADSNAVQTPIANRKPKNAEFLNSLADGFRLFKFF